MMKNVIEYLQKSAEKYPDKAAFIDETQRVTFSELDARARRISAAILSRCGPIRNQPVAVYMDKSVDCVISFLGAAYSGNFYSPIDLKMPSSRIQRMMDVLQPAVVLYKEKALDGFDPDRQISVLDAAEEAPPSGGQAGYQAVLDTDPLYVLFTSGSTGQPKGVVISHRGVIDYTEWLYHKFRFDDKTVFGNQAPFYFDNSILDIYSTLKNGAQMNIIPERFFLFPNKLLEYLNENNVNTLFWVPSALIGLANSGLLPEMHLHSMERILFCGEVMPNKQLNIWRKEYPELLYANLYGPTEITDVCACYIVDREFSDDEPLPIGAACENTEILVLNEQDELVSGDEIGELCVRGSCLSMGYYGDFEKTACAFTQNPLNHRYHERIYRTGDLVKYNARRELLFVGRKDGQIKHQGYRIELGEIETIASSMEGVERVCALYDEAGKKIVLFYSAKAGSMVTEKAVYAWLKGSLPPYMLPAAIRAEKALPINSNGKIDRAALKKELRKEGDLL